MSTRKFTVHVNGHAGHRGNVLVFAFLDRVKAVLDAFSHAERNYLGVTHRFTDYEIVSVAKTNPTELTLTPVTDVKGYSPGEFFDWTVDQLGKIADGEPVDEKIDEGLARRLSKITPLDHHIGATGVWITSGSRQIVFDKNFKMRAEAIAQLREAMASKPRWATAKTHGSVTGELLQVDDWEGKAEFAIKPPIGANRIICKFPEPLRPQVQENLFKTARFLGLLHYASESPFPYLLEVTSIEPLKESIEAEKLVKLRGIFEGMPRPTPESMGAFDGL